MKNQTALHVISYLQAVEATEKKLNEIGWDAEIPAHGTYSYSLHEVVMDLLGIPPEVNGFVRDIYFDCFYEKETAVDVLNHLLETFEENKPEYIKAGLIEK